MNEMQIRKEITSRAEKMPTAELCDQLVELGSMMQASGRYDAERRLRIKLSIEIGKEVILQRVMGIA